MFESSRDLLAKKLRERLELVDGNPNHLFAPRTVARDVFRSHRDRLKELYTEIQLQRDCPVLAINAEAFVERILSGCRPVHRIFAILVNIGASLDGFHDFEVHCTSGHQGAFLDEDLPTDRDKLGQYFPHCYEGFYREQFTWCPIILRQNEKVEYTGLKQFCPLPRLSRNPIGRGAFGDVSEIQLEEGHLELSLGNSRRALFAQKDFVIAKNGPQAFESEWEAIDQIISARKTHEHISTPIAGLVWGSEATPIFSMFSILATCNLEEYLNGTCTRLGDMSYPEGGLNPGQKQELLYQAVALVDALDHLHHGLDVDSNGVFTLWHLDLKPHNVLVTVDSPTARGGRGGLLFQIADFGLSRAKKAADSATSIYNRCGDRVGSLLQRRAVESATTARAGDACDCLSPEGYGEGSRVTAASDVWSMGCILSMILLYAECGDHEVRSFATQRAREPRSGSWFFEKTEQPFPLAQESALYYDPRTKLLFQLNREVGARLRYLVDAATTESQKSGLKNVVDIILKHMLIPEPQQRANSREAYELLKSVRRSYFNGCSEGNEGSEPRRELPTNTLLSTGERHQTEMPQNKEEAVPTTSRAKTTDSTLCNAATIGDVATCSSILESVAFDDDGYAKELMEALSTAVNRGHLSVVQLLLTRRHMLKDRPDQQGHHILTIAAEQGRANIMGCLVESAAFDVNCCSSHYYNLTPLCCAAREGHVEVVAALLQSAAIDVNWRDSYGRTALSRACQSGHSEVVQRLLKIEGIDFQSPDFRERTPRDHASEARHHSIVAQLDKHERARRGFRGRINRLRNTALRRG